MYTDDCNYCYESREEKVVNTTLDIYKSFQKQYFVGQTRTLSLVAGEYAWAALVNPCDSDVNMYINVSTVTNYSDDFLVEQVWFGEKTPTRGCVSNKVMPSNLTPPLPCGPRANIMYDSLVTEKVKCAVNPFNRIVPAESTLVIEDGGKYVLPPGTCMLITLKCNSTNCTKCTVAFGWWEERI